MTDYNLEEINKSLSKSEENFDTEGGYEVLLAGVAKRLPEIYGENTAKNFAFQVGSSPGAEIANKVLDSRDGRIYEDPIKATIGLFQRLPRYYKISVTEISQSESGNPIISFKMKSYLDQVYEKRHEIERGATLCQINKGYITTALEKLTDRKVSYNHACTDEIFCEISIEFK